MSQLAQTIHIDLPSDVTADVEVWGSDLSVDRFHEIVREKGGRAYHTCIYAHARHADGETEQGYYLEGCWTEGDREIRFHGPIDEATSKGWK